MLEDRQRLSAFDEQYFALKLGQHLRNNDIDAFNYHVNALAQRYGEESLEGILSGFKLPQTDNFQPAPALPGCNNDLRLAKKLATSLMAKGDWRSFIDLICILRIENILTAEEIRSLYPKRAG